MIYYTYTNLLDPGSKYKLVYNSVQNIKKESISYDTIFGSERRSESIILLRFLLNITSGSPSWISNLNC